MSPKDQSDASELLRSLKRDDYLDYEADSSDAHERITALRCRLDDAVSLLEIICRAHGVQP